MNVILGIPSSQLENYADPLTTKIGGFPDTMFSTPQFPPLCKKCEKPMTLLVQIYAPTTVDRQLFLFHCCLFTCFRMWKVRFILSRKKCKKNPSNLLY